MKFLSILLLVIIANMAAKAQTISLVKDINPGVASGFNAPKQVWPYNDKVLLVANDGAHGTELWISDGTEAGTTVLKDINPGSSGSDPDWFALYNGKYYFAATDAVAGRELWVTDGTESGTQLVKNVASGSNSLEPKSLGVMGSKLFFLGRDVSGSSGRIWAYNGTDFTNLGAASPYGSSGAHWLVCGANTVWFAENGNLWKTDGTALGTRNIKSMPENFDYYTWQTVIDNKLYFGYGSGDSYTQPWVSDGTTTGTFEIKHIVGPSGNDCNPRSFTKYGDKVYFSALHQFWRTDGTEAGTEMVKDIDLHPIGNLQGERPVVWNNKMYFPAEQSGTGHELWQSDGTPDGTTLVRDLTADFLDSHPSYLTPAPDGFLYFTARPDYSLWRTDGTEAGTTKMFNTTQDADSQPYWSLLDHNGRLWFTAEDKNVGRELYVLNYSSSALEAGGKERIILYPNPASTPELTLSLSGTKIPKGVVISLSGISGEASFSSIVDNESESVSIPVQHLKPGAYVLYIRQEGNVIAATIFMKK